MEKEPLPMPETGEKKATKPGSKPLRILIILLPLGIAFGIFNYLKATKIIPKASEEKAFLRKVRTMKAFPVEIQKTAVGYGQAESAREWTGYSEVKGRVLALGFSLFTLEDLEDPAHLALLIKEGKDSLSHYFKESLSEETRGLLKKWVPQKIPSETLQEYLLFEINQLLRRPSFYHPSRFSMPLNPDLEGLLKKNPQGQERLYFHRRLVENAYPKVFRRGRYYPVEEGYFIPQGAVIYQIDPDEYFLTAQQKTLLEEQTLIQVRELEEQETLLKKTLSIEEQRASLLMEEYSRRKKEKESNAASPAEVERELNNYLHQVNVIENIKSSLRLLPIKLNNLKNALMMAHSQLQQARIDLSKTVVRAPYNLRITKKNIELNQPVSPGQILIQGYGIESVDVVGQFQFRDMQKYLFPEEMKFDFAQFLQTSGKEFFHNFDLHAIVRLAIGEAQGVEKIEWKGKLSRIGSSIETSSQTLSVVVSVENPYLHAMPGKRPPLVKGMYCEIILLGRKISPSFCIPRSACHNGEVYLLKNGKLEIRKLSPDFFQDDYAIFLQGFQKGEEIILSDVFPAIPQMAFSSADSTEEVKKNYPWFVFLSSKKEEKK